MLIFILVKIVLFQKISGLDPQCEDYTCFCNSQNTDECLKSLTVHQPRFLQLGFNLEINFTNFVNLKMIIFKQNNTILLRQCSNRLYRMYELPNFVPVIPTYSRILFPKIFKIFNLEYDRYFQACLNDYCGSLYYRKSIRFACIDNRVQSLNFIFENIINMKCLESITYFDIRSENLTSLGDNSTRIFNFASNIVNLALITNGMLTGLNCNTFKLFRKLRILKIIHSGDVNVSCLILKNPDLVEITTRYGLFWNLCNNNVEVWTQNGSDFFFLNFAIDNVTNHSLSTHLQISVYFVVILVVVFPVIVTVFLARFMKVWKVHPMPPNIFTDQSRGVFPEIYF